MSTETESIEAVAADLALTMSAEFVPFSQSRKAGDKNPSLNWRVTLWRGRGRKHRCQADCGHEWTTPVTLSKHTPNLSGEETPYCPKCGKRPLISYPASDGVAVLAVDYTAGSGHCPGDKRQSGDSPSGYEKRERVRRECETGRPARCYGGMRTIDTPGGKPINPEFPAVLAALCTDAQVIDYGGFEEWATENGYDTDSRAAEAIYRACLDTALKLRAGIGEDGFKRLREACHGY